MLPQPFFWPSVLFCALLEIMKSQVSVFVSPPLSSPLKTRFLSITGTSLCHRSSIKCIKLDSFEELLTGPPAPQRGQQGCGEPPMPTQQYESGFPESVTPTCIYFPTVMCVLSVCPASVEHPLFWETQSRKHWQILQQ